MQYLGLGKTLFNSSACLLEKAGSQLQIELILSERVNRNKASGAWPEEALQMLLPAIDAQTVKIAESRDVITPALRESILEQNIPFEDYLRSRGLSRYSSRNPEVQFITHHRCHAMAALALSPFRKSIILVIDGAGTRASDFPPDAPVFFSGASAKALESCTAYLQDNGNLRCVEKIWQTFEQSKTSPPRSFSDGLGMLYENSAEYIFNCKHSAGKVMGLAAFGHPERIEDRRSYLNALDWSASFHGKGKREWEQSGAFSRFSDLAASVQQHFEETVLNLARTLRERFPDYENLILAGGCALNCTTNMKLLRTGLFREIYVPPFPGDESIGLGAAAALLHQSPGYDWEPVPHERQQGYFGARSSMPNPLEIERAFSGYELIRPASITAHCAERLANNEIIAWYQGRSESGPRALGNRSILARPDVPGLKDKLNASIKFRENFRPYGCSCTHEKAPLYFEVPPGFNSPFMSFAAKTRPEYLPQLREVTHADGTSRFQTVRAGQNRLFHELLEAFGRRTNLFCLLNTSLNVMGEPIVETIADAKRFFDQTPVDGIAIGDTFIRHPGAKPK